MIGSKLNKRRTWVSTWNGPRDRPEEPYSWSGSNFVSKGGDKAPTKVLSNLAFQKNSIQNTKRNWLWSFLVAWVLPIPSGPPLWCMPEKKFHYNPSTHFFTSGQYYPLQPRKIPCEFLVHSHLLASVLASNYPNVNPKCELQAWWTNE
jgi:hypothetical protein